MLEVVEGDETCISCCNRNRKAKKIKINRNGSSKQGENIICKKAIDNILP